MVGGVGFQLGGFIFKYVCMCVCVCVWGGSPWGALALMRGLHGGALALMRGFSKKKSWDGRGTLHAPHFVKPIEHA